LRLVRYPVVEAVTSLGDDSSKAYADSGRPSIPPEVAAAGRNGERDFHGEKPSNATHASNTDPAAQLYRSGVARKPNSTSWAMG
jgi:hypothetical protein